MIELQQKYIKQLDGITLPLLLNKLITAECLSNNIPLNSVHLTLPDRISIRDGGADAIFKCDTPVSTDFLFSNDMIFQVKATSNINLTSEVKKENIAAHIRNGGAYVLFCNKLYSEGCYTTNKEDEFKKQIAEELNIPTINVNFKLYDHSQMASWIGRYYPIKIWLLQTIGAYSGVFQDFERWQQDKSLQNPLKTNDNLNRSIEDIGSCICSNSIIRIEGQSGIGKSRQLLEAIRKHKEIQNLVLYTNQITNRFNDIRDEINLIIDNKQKAFVILDDCPYKEFTQIKKELNTSPNNITFISLDYESEDNYSNRPLIPSERIILSQVDDEVIRDILVDSHGGIDENELQHLVELCGQNPRMAMILNLYSDALDFSSCIESETLEKMTQTHREDRKFENLRTVLEVCSLFKTIYFTQDNDSELSQIALLAELSESETQRCFNRLKNNLRVIQTRYEFHYVIPKVLAFQMILSWLENSPSSLKNKLNDLPVRMKQSCYEQLECLNVYPQVKSLAEKLLVPFAKREMLNSKFGAECFLRLSNIVPGVALKKLQETFSGFSRNDYLQIKEGRRAIVSSLQVIAFHEEYFKGAAEIMLALADAENEGWSNNATGEFISFFKLCLGGTTCPASKRLSIIKDVLSDGIENKVNICLDALDKALSIDHFVRTSGPEKQGSIKLEDWKPHTLQDIQTYISAVLDILKDLILDTSFVFRQKAKDIIGQNLRCILQYHNIDVVIFCLIKLVEFDNTGWDKIRIALNHFHKFDEKTKDFTLKEVEKIKMLENILSPKTLVEQVHFYLLSKASWSIYHDKKGNEEIVNEYVSLLLDDLETLYLLLSDLNEVNNYRVFLLGRKLAECISDDRIKQIIDNSINALLLLQKTKQLNGCSFLSGVMDGVSDALTDNYIKKWSLHKETAIFVLMMSRVIKYSTFRYNQLIQVIDKYDWDEYLYFYMPIVGKSSYAKEYDDVFKLVVSLRRKSNKGSLQALIIIFHSILSNNKEIPEPLIQVISEIINDWDTIKQIDNSGLYNYECKKLWNYCYNLLAANDKYNVLSQILQHIVKDDDTETSMKYFASDLVKELLAKQSLIALQAIFDFCSQNHYNFIYFDIYLSDNFDGKENSYIDNFSWDVLKKLIDKNKEFGLFVAKSTALFEKDNISNNFKNILENYIENKDIMEELTGNIYNFSWMGNVSDYYRKVKNALVPLSEHSNNLIKEWTRNIISTLDERIKQEQKREDLLKLGLH